jgi:transposase
MKNIRLLHQHEDYYLGIDVHKNSWTVTVRTLGLEIAHFTQPPDADRLHGYLQNKFPSGKYFSAYEAGFSGTSTHYALCQRGISNIIVNPADIPQTDKQKNNKNDLHDSRSIARYLEKGLLFPIYVMSPQEQERKALFRCREVTVRDATRTVNRLRSFLYFFGIEVPDKFKNKTYISKPFLAWVSSLRLSTECGNESLQEYIHHLMYYRDRVLQITNSLKEEIVGYYKSAYTCMLTVPGVGPVTAMAVLAEIGDLARFKDPDEFASYLGLIPSEHRSGDTVYGLKIQPRCNMHLRPLLIEAAWFSIRKCPAFLEYYKKHVGKNNKKAIVKVARKLALVLKSVSLNQTAYQSYYQQQNQK